MTDTPELNVWRDACDLSSYRPLPSASTLGTIAAAVIRTYGDQRYQAAIDDVVKWLGEEFPYDIAIRAKITRRFGKDQDHG